MTTSRYIYARSRYSIIHLQVNFKAYQVHNDVPRRKRTHKTRRFYGMIKAVPASKRAQPEHVCDPHNGFFLFTILISQFLFLVVFCLLLEINYSSLFFFFCLLVSSKCPSEIKRYTMMHHHQETAILFRGKFLGEKLNRINLIKTKIANNFANVSEDDEVDDDEPETYNNIIK